MLSPPLKWHGGKHYLAKRIVALMPPHLHYVEPFFGGGAVLMAKDPNDPSLWADGHTGVSELVNDLNHRLTNFWRVLQNPKTFDAFKRHLEATPFSRIEWQDAHQRNHLTNNPIADAIAFFIDCRQSRSGLMTSFSPITRRRTRRGMNGNVSEWLSAVDGLPEVHARLRRVVIECMDALELIPREDTPETLFYCDPPYLHETRTSPDAYSFEMSEKQHEALLDVLRQCKGKVMLSGYPSQLYDQCLADWNRHEFDLPNNAAGGKNKRRMREVVWCNF